MNKTMTKTLNKLLAAMGLGLLLAPGLTTLAADPVWLEGKTDSAHEITVYRSASCGCCKGWISHLEEHNFQVRDITVTDMTPHKDRLGVPPQGRSCHTAEVNGKVIEGHVPAQDIKRLLASDNPIRLLTVPGMPSGGPGMDMPGAPKHDFSVYAVTEDNRVETYRHYSGY